MSALGLYPAHPTDPERGCMVNLADNEHVDTLVGKILKACDTANGGASVKEMEEVLSDMLGNRSMLVDLSNHVLTKSITAVGDSKGGGQHTTTMNLQLGDISIPPYAPNTFARTTAKPFMPLELLEYPEGTIHHIRQHDLESILWVLVWLCHRDPNWDDKHRRNIDVCASKMYYSKWAKPHRLPEGIEEKYEGLWRPAAKTAVAWMRVWGEAYQVDELERLSDQQVVEIFGRDEGFPYPEERMRDWDWTQFQSRPYL
ncbi:hypothetical protein NMY22_g2242 [Coprinellus aureogranulatus]|nr:hypothetical protein NMY22_g2242 [Coprinellus aureogranulatus]